MVPHNDFLGSEDIDFTVYYDENHKRQEMGGDSTIIHLTWE